MDVKFFKTSSGREPVKDYIDGLPERDQAAATDAIDAIIELGLEAPGLHFRQIRGKLWEFRFKGDASHRIFYVIISGPKMILLHAYKKRGQKAPADEIDVAERRMKEVLKDEE